MSATGDWNAIELMETVQLINWRVGVWNHLQYPAAVPAAGEHSADAIRAAHDTLAVIDAAIRELHKIRGLLTGELRADEDARAVRVDAMIAAGRARREVAHG